jgi:replicative DNA helicase
MTIEHAVIGGAIISNGQTIDELPLLPTEFHEWALQDLWTLILDRVSKNKSVDALSLIEKNPKLADVIHACVSACYSLDLIPAYVLQVKENAMGRRVKELAHKIVDSVDEPMELIDFAQSEIAAIADSQPIGDQELIAETLDKYLETLGQKQCNPTSGLTNLDVLLNGFKPGGLYIIGARPGVGKSVLGLQMAWGFARNANDLPVGEKAGLVLFHSLEMSKRELMNRLMSSQFEISLDQFEQGTLTTAQIHKIKTGEHKIKRLISINDNGGQSLASIRAYARSYQRKGMPLKAIVIDYMGLINDANEGRSRYEAMTKVSAALKRLAKDLEVPVIALAQLNRDVENRSEESLPTLSDLRDSGSIEQDADVVILLSRNKKREGEITLSVAKNRHGETGVTNYAFVGHYSKIKEIPKNH